MHLGWFSRPQTVVDEGWRTSRARISTPTALWMLDEHRPFRKEWMSIRLTLPEGR